MSIWVQVTSGRGPVECCWAVTRVALALERDAAAAGCQLQWLEPSADDVPDTNHSIVFSLAGDKVPAWLQSWLGTVQWIGNHSSRPNHKRKNWFVGVEVLEQPETAKYNLDKDVRVETFRSSGPGGQNVNKVASAVRVIHLPTGVTAEAQDQRSQHQNRSLAFERLKRRLQDADERKHSSARRELWSQHNQLERGNPVKVFRGPKFELDR